MAKNIIGHALGQSKQVFDGIDAVADVRVKLGLDSSYQGSVNGEPAEDSYELDDGDLVTFTKKVKGGLN